MGIDSDKLLEELADGGGLDQDVEHKLILMIEEAVHGKSGRQASVDDVYGYVLVLGKAKSTKAIRAFNLLIDNWRDSLTVSRVIEILCLEWDKFEDYLERVISFAVGVSWDEDEDVKQSAIRILGEYLANNICCDEEHTEALSTRSSLSGDQREVVLFLLRTFYDTSHESWTRQTAYTALLRASGVAEQDLPNDCVLLNFAPDSSDIQWQRLEFLESLADYDKFSSSSSDSESKGICDGPAIR